MIEGNVDALIQTRTTTKNAIGESEELWGDVQTIHGWLDFQSGDSKYTTYNAKIQESTHIFICDYVPLEASIKAENSRMIVDGGTYDILLIDDPMRLHQQWEIYLRYTGGR